jgi:hypothetical protein
MLSCSPEHLGVRASFRAYIPLLVYAFELVSGLTHVNAKLS